MNHVSRKQWGAQTPKGGAFTRLNRRRVAGVVVHHSGVERPPRGTNAVKAYESHHLSKGWDGIGYNWLMRREPFLKDEAGMHAVPPLRDGILNQSPSVTPVTGTGNLMSMFLSRSRR